MPELAAAWADDTDPRQVMVGDWGMRRFRCANGHHPRVAPARFLEAGCQFCQANTTRQNRKWLADTVPEIAAQWHPTRNGKLTPSDVIWDSQRVVWWQADCCGHEWQESVRNRDKYQRVRCPQCRTLLGSLASENPGLAAEWSNRNPISAWQVRPHSSHGFLPEWVCRTDPEHVWWAPVSSRSNGSGCPECRETGKSQVELAHHAAAVKAFGNARSGVRLRHPTFTSRPSWTADILVEINDGNSLVIEYDGAYWHRPTEKVLVDERKSVDLLAADTCSSASVRTTYRRCHSSTLDTGSFASTRPRRDRRPPWMTSPRGPRNRDERNRPERGPLTRSWQVEAAASACEPAVVAAPVRDVVPVIARRRWAVLGRRGSRAR